MLDHPLGASTLNVFTRRLAQQLINVMPQKTSLTDTVGTHQCRGGDVALRQPPGLLQGGRRRLDVSGDDPLPQHVDDGDDILLDTGIQQASQRRQVATAAARRRVRRSSWPAVCQNPVNRVEAALRKIACDLNALHIRWALVGGFAVSVRTEPRFTRDVDVAVVVDDDQAAGPSVRSRQRHVVSSVVAEKLRTGQVGQRRPA
jgi:hypothetical protein